MNMPATAERTAIAIDIDPPFRHVLAAWLGARAYRASFAPLSAAFDVRGGVDLVICELAVPKQSGGQALRELAHRYPDAPLIAISTRFVADTRRGALARQLGVHAALAKPCSRYDFDAALDAAIAMFSNARHPQDDPHAAHGPRHGR